MIPSNIPPEEDGRRKMPSNIPGRGGYTAKRSHHASEIGEFA